MIFLRQVYIWKDAAGKWQFASHKVVTGTGVIKLLRGSCEKTYPPGARMIFLPRAGFVELVMTHTQTELKALYDVAT